MTEQEQKDLDEMKKAVAHEKEMFFEMCKSIERATETDLIHMGQRGKTKGEAMQTFFLSYSKKIDKLMKDHVRRYPDEGIRR